MSGKIIALKIVSTLLKFEEKSSAVKISQNQVSERAQLDLKKINFQRIKPIFQLIQHLQTEKYHLSAKHWVIILIGVKRF